MEVRDSCVFYTDWYDAAQSIESPILRCAFLEAVLQYALTGMEMDVPPELKLSITIIKKQIDRNREKYDKICEKRREAINKRWNKTKQDDTKDTNEYNSIEMYSNVTDNDNVNENGNGNDNGNDNDRIINDSNKKNPPTPFGGIGGGGAKSFNDFFESVKSISVPKKVIDARYELQYIWRMADGIPGYGLEVRKAIETTTSKDQFESAIQEANRKFKPSSDFQAVKLAVAMSGLKSQAQVNAVIAEVQRVPGEAGIYATMLDKVEYMKAGNKVGSLAGFMKSRK